MRLITDEQLKLVEAALMASQGMHYTVVIPNEKALATLQALPEVEVVAWKYTFLGTPETTEMQFSPCRLAYTPSKFIETVLYATKDKT